MDIRFAVKTRLILVFAMACLPALATAKPRLIYFPRAYSVDELKELSDLGLFEIRFETGQGAQVAFYKQSVKALPARVWLVFGGNGARAADYRDIAADGRDGYLFANNLKELGRLCAARPDARVVLFHGAADAIVPVEMGRPLNAEQPENVALFVIEGGDHSRIVSSARKEILREMKGVGEPRG